MAKNDNDLLVILFAEVWSKDGIYPSPVMVRERLIRYWDVLVSVEDVKSIYASHGLRFDSLHWRKRKEEI